MVGRVEGELIKQGLHAGVQELLLYGTPLGLFLGALGALRSLGLLGSKDLGIRLERTLFVPIDGRFPLPGYDSKDRPSFNQSPAGLSLFAKAEQSSGALEARLRSGFVSWQKARRQLDEGLARERAELLKQPGAKSNLAAIDAGQRVTLAAIQANYDAQLLFDRDAEPTFSEQNPGRLLTWIGSLGRYAAAAAEYGYVPLQLARVYGRPRGGAISSSANLVLDLDAGWSVPPGPLPAWPEGVRQVLDALGLDARSFELELPPENAAPAQFSSSTRGPALVEPEPELPPALTVRNQALGPFVPLAPMLELPALELPRNPLSELLNFTSSQLSSTPEHSTQVAADSAAASSSTSAATKRGTVPAALILAGLAGALVLAGR